MQKNFDLTPFHRGTIGFEQLIKMLEGPVGSMPAPTYPPYNIEKLGEDAYRLSVAVAGFAPEDISIEASDDELVVSAKKPEDEENKPEFIYRGIASRAFERKFVLGQHVKVTTATHLHGILNIHLERKVPDSAKLRKIEIAK